MKYIIACIDGGAHTAAVCDYAAWAAQSLSAPLTFLHVLERSPRQAPVTDLSGNLTMNTQEELLEELALLDEERARVSQEHGRYLLQAASERAAASGVGPSEGVQRHGTLADTLLDIQDNTRLLVIGQHPMPEGGSRLHVDQHVERAVRSVSVPVLISTATFTKPRKFAIAFDGSPTGRRMIQDIAESTLLHGLPCTVVMAEAEAESTIVINQLRWAQAVLRDAGFAVDIAVRGGDADAVLLDYTEEHALDLLVMGAYGHSRIRELVVGSTTTAMLRKSTIPLLVFR